MGRVALLFILLYQFIFASPVYAVSLTVNSVPASINEDQEFDLNLSFSCSGCKDSYFRAVFFKEGSSNYFGYTQNEKGDWINSSSDKTLYYHLAPDDLIEGSWSGKLRAKADIASGFFQESGLYSFKVGRYTSANSSAAWSNSVSVTLNHITPTPTPTQLPTPTSTPTPSPTRTPSPTPTITRIPTQTSTPTPVKTTTATPAVVPVITLVSSPSSETSSSAEITSTPTREPETTSLPAGRQGEVAGMAVNREKTFDSLTISAVCLTLICASLFLARRLHPILRSKRLK